MELFYVMIFMCSMHATAVLNPSAERLEWRSEEEHHGVDAVAFRPPPSNSVLAPRVARHGTLEVKGPHRRRVSSALTSPVGRRWRSAEHRQSRREDWPTPTPDVDVTITVTEDQGTPTPEEVTLSPGTQNEPALRREVRPGEDLLPPGSKERALLRLHAGSEDGSPRCWPGMQPKLADLVLPARAPRTRAQPPLLPVQAARQVPAARVCPPQTAVPLCPTQGVGYRAPCADNRPSCADNRVLCADSRPPCADNRVLCADSRAPVSGRMTVAPIQPPKPNNAAFNADQSFVPKTDKPGETQGHGGGVPKPASAASPPATSTATASSVGKETTTASAATKPTKKPKKPKTTKPPKTTAADKKTKTTSTPKIDTAKEKAPADAPTASTKPCLRKQKHRQQLDAQVQCLAAQQTELRAQIEAIRNQLSEKPPAKTGGKVCVANAMDAAERFMAEEQPPVQRSIAAPSLSRVPGDMELEDSVGDEAATGMPFPSRHSSSADMPSAREQSDNRLEAALTRARLQKARAREREEKRVLQEASKERDQDETVRQLVLKIIAETEAERDEDARDQTSTTESEDRTFSSDGDVPFVETTPTAQRPAGGLADDKAHVDVEKKLDSGRLLGLYGRRIWPDALDGSRASTSTLNRCAKGTNGVPKKRVKRRRVARREKTEGVGLRDGSQGLTQLGAARRKAVDIATKHGQLVNPPVKMPPADKIEDSQFWKHASRKV